MRTKGGTVILSIIIAAAILIVLNQMAHGVSHGANATTSRVVIVAQSQKSAGIGDGSFYNYVTVKNTGNSLVSLASVNSTCTNDAGSVVGTGYGNAANLAAGEQVVIDVLFFGTEDCAHISSRVSTI